MGCSFKDISVNDRISQTIFTQLNLSTKLCLLKYSLKWSMSSDSKCMDIDSHGCISCARLVEMQGFVPVSRFHVSKNRIFTLVVTQMPGMQQELCMKCVCCSQVSNDNIKQIYDHAIHPNGKGEHTHIDVKRYMSPCETSIMHIQFFCSTVEKVKKNGRCRKGYKEEVHELRRGSRRSNRVKKEHHLSFKVYEEGEKV